MLCMYWKLSDIYANPVAVVTEVFLRLAYLLCMFSLHLIK